MVRFAFRRRVVSSVFFAVSLFFAVLAQGVSAQPDIAPFVGSYEGSADLSMADGTVQHRDMNVDIAPTEDGFSVRWTSVTYRTDGRTKEKSYEIDFVPSDREGVFSAAQKTNVFGHSVQLDPMKGEPYVWARIAGDTLTVYSLFVDSEGGYEMQQFDRSLTEGGLDLDFERLRNGERQRSVSTFLERQ